MKENYDAEIRKILKAKRSLKIDSSKARIRLLGSGENNRNYLVAGDGRKVNFRIAMYPHIEKNMPKEFRVLKKIPEGFGPEPILLDNTKKFMPHVYCVLGYIEGKAYQRWTDEMLRLHAKKLAQLHRKTMRQGRIDIIRLLEKEIKGYSHSPEVMRHPLVKRLIPKIRGYVKDNRHLFNIKKVSLIHQDPCMTNVIFNKGSVRYIDWEWAKYRDNAIDVVMVYDTKMSQRPWKMKLDGKRLDIYLDTYLKHCPDKTLKQRVKVYETILRFTDTMFYVYRLANYDTKRCELKKSVYQERWKRLQKVIKRQFNI